MDAEEVVRTYSDMIYKIACRYVRNTQDAEDVLSETFLTYFKKDREFESEEHRKAWLIKVTINCAKDQLKGRQYNDELNEEIDCPDESASSDKSDDIMDLREAIRRLPEHQREVITLFYMQDMPIERIAEILDKNKNTVSVTLMRARDNIRAYMEKQQ